MTLMVLGKQSDIEEPATKKKKRKPAAAAVGLLGSADVSW